MDKKALIREYKETQRPMGVYQVRNTVNGKVLIGTSVDLPAILNRLRGELRLGGLRNRALQLDWNEHGPKAFEVEILDTLPPSDKPGYNPRDDLKALEALWLEKLMPFDERGYNARPKS
ncbi:MAG TPA: GIY-YIG nuclease family protein [Thermoanaerobaculia bacterium]